MVHVQEMTEKHVIRVALLLSNAQIADHLGNVLRNLDYRVCQSHAEPAEGHLFVVDTKTLLQVSERVPKILFVASLSPRVIEIGVRTRCLGLMWPSQGALEVKALFDFALVNVAAQYNLKASNARLLRKLRERKTVEMAKQVLQKRYLVGEERAYSMIRQIAMNTRRTLGEVADEILLKHE